MHLPAPVRAAALVVVACIFIIWAITYMFPRLRARRVEPMLLLGDRASADSCTFLGAWRSVKTLAKQVSAASGVPCPVKAILAGGAFGLTQKAQCDPLVRAEPFLVDRLSERTTDYSVWMLQGGLYATASLPAGFLRTWLSVARLSALAVSMGYGNASETIVISRPRRASGELVGEQRRQPAGMVGRGTAGRAEKETGKGSFLLLLERKRVTLILEPSLSTFQQTVN